MAARGTHQTRNMLEFCVMALTPTESLPPTTHAPFVDSCPPIFPMPAVCSIFLPSVFLAAYRKSIDDAFFERDVEMLELAFDGQMHFGCFYAHVKLKEQVRVAYHKSRRTPPRPCVPQTDQRAFCVQPTNQRAVGAPGFRLPFLFVFAIRARWGRGLGWELLSAYCFVVCCFEQGGFTAAFWCHAPNRSLCCVFMVSACDPFRAMPANARIVYGDGRMPDAVV